MLADGEVHLWWGRLDLDAERLATLYSSLDVEESQRAARFHFDLDRLFFVASHGMLRSILGGYLGADPASIEFRRGPRGKPELAGRELCFNLSHAGNRAVVAVARQRQVGVDVERVRPAFAWLEIVERFFSPGEVAALRALKPGEQTDAFFRCWTRKEAYLKARGDGIALGLKSFDVSLAPGEPARILGNSLGEEETGRWQMETLEPEPDYVGALVIERPECALRCWEWEPQ